MVRFIRTLCEKKYKSKLPEYAKKKHFPIEESLRIIEESIKEDLTKKSKSGDKDTF
jgi:hypothetical protein